MTGSSFAKFFLKREIECKENALSMTSSNTDAISSFLHKSKTEYREKKMSNKYLHANTLNDKVKFFWAFCKSNELLSVKI